MGRDAMGRDVMGKDVMGKDVMRQRPSGSARKAGRDVLLVEETSSGRRDVERA